MRSVEKTNNPNQNLFFFFRNVFQQVPTFSLQDIRPSITVTENLSTRHRAKCLHQLDPINFVDFNFSRLIIIYVIICWRGKQKRSSFRMFQTFKINTIFPHSFILAIRSIPKYFENIFHQWLGRWLKDKAHTHENHYFPIICIYNNKLNNSRMMLGRMKKPFSFGMEGRKMHNITNLFHAHKNEIKSERNENGELVVCT